MVNKIKVFYNYLSSEIFALYRILTYRNWLKRLKTFFLLYDEQNKSGLKLLKYWKFCTFLLMKIDFLPFKKFLKCVVKKSFLWLYK